MMVHKMKNRVQLIPYILGRGLLVTLCLSGIFVAHAREGDGRKPMLAEHYRDYFQRNVDLKTRQQVNNVNRLHLQPALKWVSRGKPNRAIPELKFVLRYVPNHPKALQLMEVSAKLTDRLPMAEGYYKQAIFVFPDYALTHAQYGKFLVESGRVEEGIQELEKAKSIPPDLRMVHVWLAEAYEKQQDHAKAQIEREKAKALEKAEIKAIKP